MPRLGFSRLVPSTTARNPRTLSRTPCPRSCAPIDSSPHSLAPSWPASSVNRVAAVGLLDSVVPYSNHQHSHSFLTHNFSLPRMIAQRSGQKSKTIFFFLRARQTNYRTRASRNNSRSVHAAAGRYGTYITRIAPLFRDWISKLVANINQTSIFKNRLR